MRPAFRLLTALTLLLGLAACASPRERRIASNPQIYQSLSTSDQVLVQQGRIREGMSKEGVFLAMGRPDGVAAGRQKGAGVEQWTYLGSQPVYTTTVGMGWGWGGAWGLRGRGCGYIGPWDPYWMGAGPMVTYVPYKAATVTFKGNRVTDYLTGPQ